MTTHNLPVGAIPELTAEDDAFHPASDHWWETETAWFSFNIPERKIGCWFYNQVLATQKKCNGGAWIWDDSQAGALYEANHRGLDIPDVNTLDLRDVQLPNGNHITMLEPLTKYRVRYNDPGKFEADLVFEGIMAPNSHPIGVAPFWTGRHFDQPMHATGTIVLHGETMEIDSLSVRDRSWGPRPMGPDPRKKSLTPEEQAARAAKPKRPPEGVGYPFATADRNNAWLLYTRPTIVDGVASDEVSTGFLLRDGKYGHLVSGRRRIWLDRGTQWIRRMELEAVDEHGRQLSATGELVSRHGDAVTPSGTGLFLWEWDGISAWGEDQTYAPADILLALNQSR